MPNKDKTGPKGLGPMTGRTLGSCNHTDKISDETVAFNNCGRRRGNRKHRRGFRK